VIKYFICFQPRSGSTFLCELLTNTEKGLFNGFEIIDYESALNAGLTSKIEAELQKGFSAPLKKEVLSRFISIHPEALSIGFKFSYYQIADDPIGFLQYLMDNRFYGIFLYRSSIFNTALSQIWSLERRNRNVSPMLAICEDDVIKELSPSKDLFDYYMMDCFLQKQHVHSMHLLWQPSKSLLLSYESLADHGTRDASLADVCNLLKINPSHLGKSIQKRISAETSEKFVNISDLHQWKERFSHLSL
jgi:hypothetical protein